MAEPTTVFGDARSVIVIGDDRRLLNWVAYAFASATDPDFLWVNIESKGEVRAPLDLFSKGLIPPNRLASLRSAELAPNNATANIAVSGVVRDDETPENLQRLMDFLRLPERSQARLSTLAVGNAPKVVVLSNAHRLGPYYPAETVAPFLRAIESTGITFLATFADAPNEGRFSFDVVLHLEGHDPAAWRQAVLRVEKGPTVGPLSSGSEHRLADLEVVRSVLARHLG